VPFIFVVVVPIKKWATLRPPTREELTAWPHLSRFLLSPGNTDQADKTRTKQPDGGGDWDYGRINKDVINIRG
jgi:hypothetical protein